MTIGGVKTKAGLAGLGLVFFFLLSLFSQNDGRLWGGYIVFFFNLGLGGSAFYGGTTKYPGQGSFLGGSGLFFFVFVVFWYGWHARQCKCARFFLARFGSGSVWAWAWAWLWVGVGGSGWERAVCFLHFFHFDVAGFVWLGWLVVRLLSVRKRECVWTRREWGQTGRMSEGGCVWMLLWDYLCYYATLC